MNFTIHFSFICIIAREVFVVRTRIDGANMIIIIIIIKEYLMHTRIETRVFYQNHPYDLPVALKNKSFS